MIVRFATKNFRGFAERIVWDLSSHSNYDFNNECICNGIIKNAIIYGPNGSGKSNFGFALFDIVNHLTQKNKLNDYYDNFVCGFAPDELVLFEYTFRFNNDIVYYSYAKKTMEIW